MMDILQPTTSTQFNSGLAIAYSVHQEILKANTSRIYGEYGNMKNFLINCEIAMQRKFRENAKAQKEIDDIHVKYKREWGIYARKLARGRRITPTLNNKIMMYMDEYQKALTYYRDLFGYGMPSKEDISQAAFR